MYVFGSGGVGGERGEWLRGLGFGYTNPVGTGECWRFVCVWVGVVWMVGWCGWCRWGMGRGL